MATLGTLKLDSANLLQHGLAWIDTNQLHAMSGDGWTDAYLKSRATERKKLLESCMYVMHILYTVTVYATI